MRLPRTRWIIVGAAALLAAVAWWRFRDGGLAVETAVIARRDFEDVLVEDGRTRASWHVDITAPVTGEWRPEALAVGDSIRAGRVLGSFRTAPHDPAMTRQLAAQLGVADAELVAARAAESAARTALSEAERALARAERLTTAGGVSEEQLDRLRAEAEARRHEQDAARARVAAGLFARDAARAQLPGDGAAVRVASPGDGVVLRVDEEHARVVPAGTPLLMVGSLGDLEVVIDVLSSDAGRIPPGAALHITAGVDTIAGTVLRVEPSARTVRSALGVDEQRVRVIGHLLPPARLGHDFEVRVRIVLGRREDALVVPTGALVRDGASWSVFVVAEDGRVSRRAVTLLARGADDSAVEGIDEGTRVVVYPPEAIAEGAKVRD